MELEEIEIIRQRIMNNKIIFESIVAKSNEQIVEEDYIKYIEADKEYNKISGDIVRLKNQRDKIERILRDAQIKVEEFPLLDKEEIISSEEEQLLEEKLNIINSIIEEDWNSLEKLRNETCGIIAEYEVAEFKKKISQPGDIELVYQMSFNGKPFPKVLADYEWSKGKYKKYDECTLKQKQEIREYEEKIKTIRESKDEKYDKKGKLTIFIQLPGSGRIREEVVELTPRQMAEAGILYDAPNIYWKSNDQIRTEEGLRSQNPDTVKDVLLNGDSKIVYVYTKKGANREGVPTISKVVPKKIFELGQYDIGMPGSIYIAQQGGGDIEYENTYTDASAESIAARNKKIEELSEKMKRDTTGKYDKLGVISIPIYSTNDRSISRIS